MLFLFRNVFSDKTKFYHRATSQPTKWLIEQMDGYRDKMSDENHRFLSNDHVDSIALAFDGIELLSIILQCPLSS